MENAEARSRWKADRNPEGARSYEYWAFGPYPLETFKTRARHMDSTTRKTRWHCKMTPDEARKAQISVVGGKVPLYDLDLEARERAPRRPFKRRDLRSRWTRTPEGEGGMSYATQITIIAGAAGSRQMKSFTLGAESSTHRALIRDLLPLPVLQDIEADDLEHGLEIEVDDFDRAIRMARQLMDLVDDEGLRNDLVKLHDFWLDNRGRASVAVFAELA